MGYGPWGRKQLDTNEQLNNNKNDKTCLAIKTGYKPPIADSFYRTTMILGFVFFLIKERNQFGNSIIQQ